jgi:hypothetical protein
MEPFYLKLELLVTSFIISETFFFSRWNIFFERMGLSFDEAGTIFLFWKGWSADSNTSRRRVTMVNVQAPPAAAPESTGTTTTEPNFIWEPYKYVLLLGTLGGLSPPAGFWNQ